MTVATVATGAVATPAPSAITGRRRVAAMPQPPIGRSRKPGAASHGSHMGGPRRADADAAGAEREIGMRAE